MEAAFGLDAVDCQWRFCSFLRRSLAQKTDVKMKIVIPGGSGQVGTILARAFHQDGHEVTVLSRDRNAARAPWRIGLWNAETAGQRGEELGKAEGLGDLTGGKG